LIKKEWQDTKEFKMPDQPERWLTLTTRFGQEIDNPNQDDLSRALEELSHDDRAGMTAADYAEHSAAYLRLESDAGPHYLLSMERDGTLTYSEFASPESDDPIVELTQKVPAERALVLMMLLVEGKCEQLEKELSERQGP
jgi:hypothetical protein